MITKEGQGLRGSVNNIIYIKYKVFRHKSDLKNPRVSIVRKKENVLDQHISKNIPECHLLILLTDNCYFITWENF